MDIETLASAVYENLGARNVSAGITDERLVLEVACDDQEGEKPVVRGVEWCDECGALRHV